ncbi:MAG TPA: 2Fe-2S iron-sulfur cluster-binding protein, partial [Sumerlaeia bacterium]|nr:2Fe-2S iron-sulfur cluster-binding protein [Sumerlaeia bacterium]
MTDTFTIAVDAKEIPAREGQTILEAALAAGVKIPHFCHDPRLTPVASCRMCIVGIDGRDGYHTACNTPAKPGMRILNDVPEIADLRRENVELILAHHNLRCTSCDKDGDCALQEYAYLYQADEKRFG